MGEKIGYARVSTADQNLDLQRDALTAAGCTRVFADTASGKLTERPELTAVLDYLRPGDTLVVWKLDRLGRSIRHLIDTITALADRGVGFASISEAMDTGTPSGKLLFHIFGALAEFERDLIWERTMAGLAAARARGRKGGRRPKLTDRQVRIARDMYASREHTVQQIADTLRVSRGTVYRHLDRATAAAVPRSGAGNPKY